ncbi:hypothetical protein TNCV_540911 [Trichonephila clavipes]|nr:hypothetical protein TNCV_540911 [Trichonephila clavipes]
MSSAFSPFHLLVVESTLSHLLITAVETLHFTFFWEGVRVGGEGVTERGEKRSFTKRTISEGHRCALGCMPPPLRLNLLSSTVIHLGDAFPDFDSEGSEFS